MALLTPDVSAIVAVAAAGGAFVALVTALAAHLRVGRVRRAYADMLGDTDGENIVEVVGGHVRAVERLRDDVAAAQRALEVVRSDLTTAVRHVSVVRYNAFNDMGGQLSFSAALLDDEANGVVISAINGRSETRSYAKSVVAGDSQAELSPEEGEAIDAAMGTEQTRRPRSASRTPSRTR